MVLFLLGANAFGLEPRCNAPILSVRDSEIKRNRSFSAALSVVGGALHRLVGQMRLPSVFAQGALTPKRGYGTMVQPGLDIIAPMPKQPIEY